MPKTREVALIVNAATTHDRKNIRGVVDYAERVGNWTLYVEEDPLRQWPGLHNWRGDGIIADFYGRKPAGLAKGLKIPLVRIGGGPGWGDPALAGAYFETDNRAIARLAAEHLIERGFRALAFCGLSRSQIAPWPKERPAWPEERAAAFQRQASEAGLPCSVYVDRRSTARRWADSQRELATWLASLEKPVGLMACNDARALHVLAACRNVGLRVPDEIAVIGVDNDEMLCELSNPPLSSVEQGTRRMGYQAAEMLDRLMSGGRAPQLKFVIPPDGVVTRRSTDALMIADANVAAAVHYIREHACDRIKVPNVVRAAKVSRSTLRTRFKAVTGRTIHAEIQRVQIEQARRLIATSSLTLKQIATRTGFRHVQYMTTLFRRYVGKTPAAYRRQWRF
jgi:LacI family transcriptional regulator